jgi:hypothetical protein
MLKMLRAQIRSRQLRTQRNTIEVVRFCSERPARVRNSGFQLFHKPRVIRSAIFMVALSAMVLWALKSYIDLFRHIGQA